MKTQSLISLLLMIGVIAWAKPPGKHALIIAIGTYPHQSAWKDLGSDNDVILMRSALISQGFDSSNIAILSNEQATFEGIQSAIRHSLLNKVRAGDIAVFHFSGHGQQIADDDGDELDGYDEAIVPYDSPQRYQAGVYEGERLLRDETLGDLLMQVRRKLGKKGQLITLLDACHSGTGTRGNTITRGTDIKMGPGRQDDFRDLPQEQANQFGLGGVKISGKPAPMIAFFASAAHELNYEYLDEKGQRFGSLSFAFSKVFANLEANSSFQGLYDKLQLEMAIIAPKQHPQVEGDLATLVMKGQTRQIPNYLKVRSHLATDRIIIEGGTLAGIYPGTEIHIYPADQDTSGQEPLTTGVVMPNNLPLISEVILSDPLSDEQVYWAYIHKQNFGNMEIRLLVNIQNRALRQELEQELRRYELIREVEEAADLILEQGKGAARDSIFLYSKDDVNLMVGELSESPTYLSRMIRNRMLNYAQAMFLRNLSMDSRFLQVELDLLPAIEDKNGQTQVPDSILSGPVSGGIPAFREEEMFVFRVKNTGKKPVYYSLLDIQPDHFVNPAFPNPDCDLNIDDCYLLPGESHVWTSCAMVVAPPYGNEVLKLIVTEEPLNLRQVINTRGKPMKKSSHPFEMLFQASYKEMDRSKRTPSIPPSTATVKSVVFHIEK